MAEEVGPVSEHLAALYTSLFGVAVDHAVVSFALLKERHKKEMIEKYNFCVACVII